MAEDLYRISWEMVNLSEMYRYSNADPFLYKNTKQTVPNSQIPDEHWHPVARETTDPWQQYSSLKRWADADDGFVRNVRLEKAVHAEREWTEVTTR